MRKQNSIKEHAIKDTLLDTSLFLVGSLLTYVTVSYAVPLVSEQLHIMPLAAWMLLAIPIVLLPLILGGALLLKTEKDNTMNIYKRLRLRKFTKSDWRWAAVGLGGLLVGSGIAFLAANALHLDTNPSFARHSEAWTYGHSWMFGLWLIYWPLNILGEEFAWRGVILPRTEKHFGRRAWWINGILWKIFHWSLGLGNLITLIPTVIFVPLVTQKTKNTWTGMILHASLSLTGFVALAFGLTG